MTPNLACADFTFPLLPHESTLRLIAMLDVEGVDIGLFEERSHLWPSREFENGSRSARQLKRKLDDQGLAAADIFLQMATDFESYALNHPDPSRRDKAREWYLRTLAYAQECGSRHATILPGVPFPDEALEESLGRAGEELAWRVERAQSQGLVCGIEAHVGSIVPDPPSALSLLARVPGLTLTLDYTHFTRAGYPDAAVEPLVPHASHMHVRGASPGRLQVNFAHNQIDYGRVVRLLQDHGYQGWLGLEYVYQDWEHCNESDTISETILFRDFLRSAWLGAATP